jgi:hypothetical protein
LRLLGACEEELRARVGGQHRLGIDAEPRVGLIAGQRARRWTGALGTVTRRRRSGAIELRGAGPSLGMTTTVWRPGVATDELC